jgi:phenylalanine-4-hydroxylase
LSCSAWNDNRFSIDKPLNIKNRSGGTPPGNNTPTGYWFQLRFQHRRGILELPRTVIVSIVAFKLFECAEFHSEYQALEVTRHTPLTDTMSLHYFELPKLPELENADDELKLWLALFKAKTEEDLQKIIMMGGATMEQAINAYRHITATDEFREIERLRSRARHNEAAALRHATETEREKWQSVIAEKDATLAEQAALIVRLQSKLEGRDH